MRKASSILAFLLFALLARPGYAQFIGYTSPQTVVVPNLLNAVSTPTASVAVTNLGQSSHYLIYVTSGTITALSLQFEGSMDCTTYVRISDVATDPLGGGLFASGYYPCVRVNLTAISGGGTVTVGYSGTSVAPGPPVGVFATGSIFKTVLVTGGAANTTTSYTVQLPPAGAGGRLYFTYHGTAPANGTIALTAGPDSTHTTTLLPATTIAANTTTQGFLVQAKPANVAVVTFTSPGVTSATYDLTYQFNQGGGASGNATPATSLNFAEATRSLNANGTTTIASLTGAGLINNFACSVVSALGLSAAITANAVITLDGSASANLPIYSTSVSFASLANDFATGSGGGSGGDKFSWSLGPQYFSSSATVTVTVSGALGGNAASLDCVVFYGTQQ